MAETLNPMTFPLWGSRLIDASAGTGKTWTIAALYLRLVLGHGGMAGFARPLLPSEILVMTFTRAATRELSDRIRSRLLEAARCFRGEADPDKADSLLTELIADYPQASARAAAAWRLAMAAESMDDAAVHTIDAWCQRMLREHAFDSACLFDEELTANEQAMLEEAAQDYWRQQLYPMSGAALDAALSVWKDVGSLADDARQLLSQALPAGAGQGDLTDLVERLVGDRQGALARIKDGWSVRARNMRAWLDQMVDHPACPFVKTRVHPRYYTPWLTALACWAEDARAEIPVLNKGAERLTPAGMLDALKPGAVVVLPEHFNAFADLMKALERLPTIAGGMRLHAASSISRRLSELKNQAGTFGFADLLNRLDAALDASVNGEAAARLRARMLAQYPVAMIDEFQDTSPQQVRIFDQLYRIEDNDPASALLLIGDPKQSIYGFRGADIYSYLRTRRATEGRHYVLATNHRSTRALVDAVNHLFEQAEAAVGEGAFMFRTNPAPGSDNPLPFVAVGARGRAESFVTAAGICPALRLELDANLTDTTSSRRHFAALCAEHIVTLLNDEKAGFERPPQGFIRLRPADIAVLVRTGTEAAAVRRELRRRNVASVYLSDKDSVFASDEARDILRWLSAVAAPLDVRLARAALASRTVGLSVDELLVLAVDDEAFDARSEQLRQLHAVWLSQGVLDMLRKSLHMLDLPGRWLGSLAGIAPGELADGQPGLAAQAGADGERRLTNFLHLAELLQAASARLEGEQALIRWLAGQIAGDFSTDDEQIVRLESDADLVKVVTVHKAKGLEYPLVFLPFASSFRGVDNARTRFVTLADEAGNRSLQVAPSAEQLTAHDKDRQREDLRLLYVALTRARHALWVGVSAMTSGGRKDCSIHRSAGGYLLGSRTQTAETALLAQIGNLVKPCASMTLAVARPLALVARTWRRGRDTPAALRDMALYTGNFERRWSISSFSALVRALAAPASSYSSLVSARDDEVLDPVERAVPQAEAEMPFRPLPGACRAVGRACVEAGNGLGLGALRSPAWRPGARSPRRISPLPASTLRAGAIFGAIRRCRLVVGAPPTPNRGPGWHRNSPRRRPDPTPDPTPDRLLGGAPVIAAQPWHSFPRGAMSGNFLHDRLEWLAEEGFAIESPEIEQRLLLACDREGWESRRQEVLSWLREAVRAPLPPTGASLQRIRNPLPEMEFWFPSGGLLSGKIDALCRAHLLGGCDRPLLPERELRGMLMGFADLVFEHEGRYWVLDYKSNYLGPGDADYGADALEVAMATHRYDVQAAIYLLALHRLLRLRLGPRYDPARQLGGAVYFFLRGLHGPAGGCYHVPPKLELLDGLDALLGQPEAVP